MIEINAPGDPVGKGRPRFYQGHAVTPKKTKAYEKSLRDLAKKAVSEPLTGPVSVSIILRFGIPDSWTKKKKAEARENRLLPTKKPDIDNCVKAVLDAMNGVLWDDDSQVVHMVVSKVYTSMEPYTQIRVWKTLEEEWK